MEPLVVISQDALHRLVAESVEAGVTKVLARLPKAQDDRPKPWLTNREAMDFLGLSKATLQRYRADGRLPYAKVGGNIYYRYEDVAAVLEAHLVHRARD